jgi:hypothetical protein
MKTIDDEIREILDRQGEIAAIKHARNRYDLDLKSAMSYVQGMRVALTSREPKREISKTGFHPRNANEHKTAEMVGQVIALLFLIVMAIGIYSCTNLTERNANTKRELERQRIETGIVTHQAVVGMTHKEVLAAWGAPEKKEHTDFQNGHNWDSWFYSDDRLVLFKDGKASSVSTH